MVLIEQLRMPRSRAVRRNSILQGVGIGQHEKGAIGRPSCEFNPISAISLDVAKEHGGPIKKAG
jgi:hypothetical protein